MGFRGEIVSAPVPLGIGGVCGHAPATRVAATTAYPDLHHPKQLQASVHAYEVPWC
jgi:hypothetical protein